MISTSRTRSLAQAGGTDAEATNTDAETRGTRSLVEASGTDGLALKLAALMLLLECDQYFKSGVRDHETASNCDLS